MGRCNLTVPLVGQKAAYDGKPLTVVGKDKKSHQHGFMACWYASATMVSFYFRPGPRQGLPQVWLADHGLSLNAIENLARVEGLMPVKRPQGGFDSDALASLLRDKGPIWAAGRYMTDYPEAGHVVVITGVDGEAVNINDPWEPKAKIVALQWLNSRVIDLSNAWMSKDTSRS